MLYLVYLLQILFMERYMVYSIFFPEFYARLTGEKKLAQKIKNKVE